MPTTNLPQALREDDQQSDPIKLDLDNYQITYNQHFKDVLSQTKPIIQRAQKLLKVDVNDMTEADMTKLRKDFRPIVKYQKQFTDFETQTKRILREHSQNLIDQFHKTLSNAGFDQVETLTKQYRAYDHDFKANRANKRWAKIKERFDASLETYPEFTKYAPKTLGSFNYYRLHHPKLISDAKTKKITKKTIKAFNDSLYQYHLDMQRLLTSTLNPVYYSRIIEQYADDPSADKMINLIQVGLKQQIKDNRQKLIDQVTPTVNQLMQTLWYQNQNITNILANAKPENMSDDDFELARLRLMKNEADAINASLDPSKFIKGDQVDTDKLELTIKPMLANSIKRIYQALEKLHSAPQKITPKPKPKTEPYAWLLDFLQSEQLTNIHDNDEAKVTVLTQLFTSLTDKQSIWRAHVHNFHDIMNLVNYIAKM